MERRHLHDPENICHTASKMFQQNARPNIYIYIYIISTIVSRIKNQKLMNWLRGCDNMKMLRKWFIFLLYPKSKMLLFYFPFHKFRTNFSFSNNFLIWWGKLWNLKLTKYFKYYNNIPTREIINSYTIAPSCKWLGNLNHNQWISQPFSGDVSSPMPAVYQDLRNIDYEKGE